MLQHTKKGLHVSKNNHYSRQLCMETVARGHKSEYLDLFNSDNTRGPGLGPYIDHVLYEGHRAGAIPFRENSVNCRHGNTFCSVHY